MTEVSACHYLLHDIHYKRFNSISNESPSKIPFITGLKSGGMEYVGIIINTDPQVTSIYDLSLLKTHEERQKLLDLGEIWWWESNRKIPINIFLKNDMSAFRHIIKTFNTKDASIIFGPTVNLNNIAERRVKRKTVQIVKKAPPINSSEQQSNARKK